MLFQFVGMKCIVDAMLNWKKFCDNTYAKHQRYKNYTLINYQNYLQTNKIFQMSGLNSCNKTFWYLILT